MTWAYVYVGIGAGIGIFTWSKIVKHRPEKDRYWHPFQDTFGFCTILVCWLPMLTFAILRNLVKVSRSG